MITKSGQRETGCPNQNPGGRQLKKLEKEVRPAKKEKRHGDDFRMSGGAKSDSRKKKALIVTTVSGFVPQFEMNNVRILQELGYEVYYASNFRNPGYGNDNSRLNGTGIQCRQIDLERSPFRFCAALRAYRQLKSLLEREYFELIHCHTPMGGMAARLAAAAVDRKHQRTAAEELQQEKRKGRQRRKELGAEKTFDKAEYKKNILKNRKNILKKQRKCPEKQKKYSKNKENILKNKGNILKREAALKGEKRESRVIYTAHGFHFYYGAPPINWLLYYPAERWLARYTDVLITINGEDYRRARSFRLKNSKAKTEKQVFHVNGVGIDLESFQDIARKRGPTAGNTSIMPEGSSEREEKRKELGIKENEFLLLSVGELDRRKNHQIVIRALADLLKEEKRKKSRLSKNQIRPRRRIIYAIAGEGKERRRLEHLIHRKALEKDVVLLGYRRDIRELLLAADCFIFPSKREGMPVALMEAIASGVRCIAADTRGCRELLDRNQLVRKNRVQEYRRALEKLEPAGKMQNGERGGADIALQSLEDISAKKISQQMKKIYMNTAK